MTGLTPAGLGGTRLPGRCDAIAPLERQGTPLTIDRCIGHAFILSVAGPKLLSVSGLAGPFSLEQCNSHVTESTKDLKTPFSSSKVQISPVGME